MVCTVCFLSSSLYVNFWTANTFKQPLGHFRRLYQSTVSHHWGFYHAMRLFGVKLEVPFKNTYLPTPYFKSNKNTKSTRPVKSFLTLRSWLAALDAFRIVVPVQTRFRSVPQFDVPLTINTLCLKSLRLIRYYYCS